MTTSEIRVKAEENLRLLFAYLAEADGVAANLVLESKRLEARRQELDKREQKIEAHDKNFRQFQEQLAQARVTIIGYREEANKADEKVRLARQKMNEALSLIGRINKAFPGLIDRLPKPSEEVKDGKPVDVPAVQGAQA